MEIVGEVIIFLGSIFLLLSSIGIGKMPDFLMKLQAASKASALGIILILIGGLFFIQEWAFLFSSLIIFIFLLMATPIGAHALALAHKKIDGKNQRGNRSEKVVP